MAKPRSSSTPLSPKPCPPSSPATKSPLADLARLLARQAARDACSDADVAPSTLPAEARDGG